MRYLVKSDCGNSLADQLNPEAVSRLRKRRGMRLLIAVCCVALTAFFGRQLLESGGFSNYASLVPRPEWDNPSSVALWLRWCTTGLCVQLRNSIEQAIPLGNLGTIVKMAVCAVAAAVFLRGPHKI